MHALFAATSMSQLARHIRLSNKNCSIDLCDAAKKFEFFLERAFVQQGANPNLPQIWRILETYRAF